MMPLDLERGRDLQTICNECYPEQLATNLFLCIQKYVICYRGARVMFLVTCVSLKQEFQWGLDESCVFANHLSTVAKWIREATCIPTFEARLEKPFAWLKCINIMYRVCFSGCCRMYMVSYCLILKMWQSNRMWYFWFLNSWTCRI